MIFPCPACCFEWHSTRRRKASGVLGYLYGILLAHGQARHGLMPHFIRCGDCPDPSIHIRGKRPTPKDGISRLAKMRKPQCTVVHEDFRIKRNAESALGDRPHSFALFSYLHSDNKVKLENVATMAFCGIGSIMEIPVELVFLAFFDNHPLVAQECCELYGFVMPQFYSLPSVALFQPFKVAVIAADIAVFKCGV